jgi:hypothetical protein
MRSILALSAAVTACLAIAPVAQAAIVANPVDFESRQSGEWIRNQYAAFVVSGENLVGGPDKAIIFDTTRRPASGGDDDLTTPWTVGNLAPNTAVGKILIVPENDHDANNDGYVDDPNDQGNSGRPIARINFAFRNPVLAVGLDLIDIDGDIEIADNYGYLEFANGNTTRRVSFREFITPTSPYYDPTVAYANRSANRIQPITSTQLGLQQITRMSVLFGGSSALDRITFQPIPEPGVAMLAIGVLPLLARRRSR